MPTYWDGFIERYKHYRMTADVSILLHAFYHYEHGDKDMSDELMEELK